MPVQEPFRAFLLFVLIKKPPYPENYYITLDSSFAIRPSSAIDKNLSGANPITDP
jgi:hypothetical protein